MIAGHQVVFAGEFHQTSEHGKDREEAIDKMRSALGEFVIQGIDTNLDFQFDIVSNPDFIKGNFDTGFIAE